MAGSYLYYPMYRTSPVTGYGGYGSTTALVTSLVGAGLSAATAIYQIDTQRRLAISAQHAEERAVAQAAAQAAAQAEAQAAAQEAALKIAQARAAGAEAEAQATGGGAALGGIPTWGWVAGGVAVLGIGALALRRRSA